MIYKLKRAAIRGLLGAREEFFADLSRALSISPPYLHDMLAGRRNPEHYIDKIAAYLEVERGIISEEVESDGS